MEMTRDQAYVIINKKLNDLDSNEGELFDALGIALNALAAIEQIRWERDCALEQLTELGLSLGEKLTPESRNKILSSMYKWLD